MKNTDFKDKKVAKQYARLTVPNLYIINPASIKTLGAVRGKTVLDLGCGSGWLSEKLARKGAKVTGIDCSPVWIEMAEKRLREFKNARVILADATDLSFFKGLKFDIAAADFVFLNISSRRRVEKIFKEVSKTLKKGGTFVFSDWHAAGKMAGKPETASAILPPGFSYFREGSKYRAEIAVSNHSLMKFINSHWSFGLYSRLLNKNGMLIEEIIEPRPAKSAPAGIRKNYNIPEFIFFKCRKIK